MKYLERIEKFVNEVVDDKTNIRSGAILYPRVKTGHNFRTGHNVLIRSDTEIGNNVLVGTNSVIEGRVKIGNNVSIQTGAFICTDVIIEDNVFIGPHVVMTNDKYPIRFNKSGNEEEREKAKLKGPIIRKGCSIGANATILGGIEIGEGAMIAAGAVVTRNVGSWRLAMGVPAIDTDLDESLKIYNFI